MTHRPLPAAPRTAAEAAAVGADDWQAVLAAAPAEAAAWMQAAARCGHAAAQAVLGQWRLDGHGIAHDAQDALHWFQCAAQQGHTMAANMVGRCHEQGWGTAVDPEKAAHWYRLAAARELPEARYNLANLMAAGRGVVQDHARAVALYRQAAEQGYAKAFGKLGRYHEDGLVLERSPALARRCYEIAAQGGDFRGQFNLAGLLAAEGRHAEALRWLDEVRRGATPKYLHEAGRALLRSAHPEYRALAQRMLERAEEAG